MVFNFKNNNFIIIFLLVLVIGSCVCYNIMQNNVEGLNNNSNFKDYFDDIDFSGVNTYYTLNVRDYDFSFVENSDIIAGLNSDTIDISCININTRNCFNITNFKKDSNFNIYKRIDSSNIKTFNAKAETTDNNIRLLATPTTSNDDKVDNVNIMFVTKSTDPSFVFDLSGEQFNKLNLYINDDDVIINGVIQGFPNLGAEREISGNSITATGGSFSMGDFNFPSLFGLGGIGGLTAEQYAYMLETGNRHPYLNNYSAPFYSSFEAAMNNPSNPLVNPLNSMNPQQYSESLFGPNISPHMVQNMCKNSKLNSNSKVEESGEKDSSEKDSGEKDSSEKDSKNNSVESSGNPMNDIFNKINANSNSMLTQNSNESLSSSTTSNIHNNTINNNGSEVPPCPPCARCPQSDFECKKVPNYEQGLENSSLPRAVLTDFSTFGM